MKSLQTRCFSTLSSNRYSFIPLHRISPFSSTWWTSCSSESFPRASEAFWKDLKVKHTAMLQFKKTKSFPRSSTLLCFIKKLHRICLSNKTAWFCKNRFSELSFCCKTRHSFLTTHFSTSIKVLTCKKCSMLQILKWKNSKYRSTAMKKFAK